MKDNLWRMGWLLATALIMGGAPARAAGVALTSDYDATEQCSFGNPVAATYAPNAAPDKLQPVESSTQPAYTSNCNSCCNWCGNACRQCCEWLGPFADPAPIIAGYAISGIDTFRGVSDGTGPNNNGSVNGFNFASPIPVLAPLGLAWQSGMSYGVYDFEGRSSNAPYNQAQQQIFVTTGFFRRADSYIPVSGGLVYDWNINNNFGAFANSPTLGQWRAQLAWAISDYNEIGFWGALRDRGDQKLVTTPAPFLQNYRAISQGNLFWHHKYQRLGADSWMYVGLPDRRRLAQGGDPFFPAGAGTSLGMFILGQNWLIPITDNVSLYANGMYMKPSAHPGVQVNGAGVPAFASTQETWNISFGCAIYPGRAARSSTVAGRKWMPYMPLANNSNFLVDTNITK